jgi:hypothetical protein
MNKNYYPKGDYKGFYKGGKPNGDGSITFSCGAKYIGEFKDGNFNGKGVVPFWPDDLIS